MIITDKISLVMLKDGTGYKFFEVNRPSDYKVIGLVDERLVPEFYKRMKDIHPAERKNVYKEIVEQINKNANFEKMDEETYLQKFIDFFTEFNFSPSIRFLNSFCREKSETYVDNYFHVINSPYAEEISHKMTSPEFKEIENFLFQQEVAKKINNRFKIYYGPQGTGKTTQALRETEGKCIVCNSSMLPSDIMEDFVFSDGKPTFQWSAFARAMMEGKTITMDEINLLPFESLRFLQGIFDGKKEFIYKGKTVAIKEGFKVIGTMNLIVNGVIFGLPEPLVDRCEEIVKFDIKPSFLKGAFR